MGLLVNNLIFQQMKKQWARALKPLPTFLILVVCIGTAWTEMLHRAEAEEERVYRVNISVLTLGWANPSEEITAQVITFLDKQKPPGPGETPQPFSPEDWIFIGNVSLRFEIRDEDGAIVDINVSQSLRTDDNGFLEMNFTAPEKEGKYTITVNALIEGNEYYDSEEFTVSAKEHVIPTITPTPSPNVRSIICDGEHCWIAGIAIAALIVIVFIALLSGLWLLPGRASR
jgi:hypothetical protein